ncbi:hypothetical protein OXX80_007372 [Metschnikowia pulcherrima]
MASMKQWHSSPTREFSSLEAIEERQRARAGQLYQPMSSPIKTATNTDQRSRLRAQMRQMRDELRHERQALSREKTVVDEDRISRLNMLQEQAEALEVDLDLLLQEESEAREENRSDSMQKNSTSGASAPDPSDTKYLQDLEEELEEFLAQEELELEAQLKDLQL